MQENYLAKWLNDELSEEELAEFKNSAEYASYQKIAEATQKLQGPNFDVEHAWSSFKEGHLNNETNDVKVVPLRPFMPFLRIAAVIALLMGGAFFYQSYQDETFTTQFAQRTEEILPDASEVILNADTQLSFNEKKWEDDRKVTLDGEAFFKVAKGEQFTVSTPIGTVMVLGTQFNVKSRGDFFEVTCYEGLVSVTFEDTPTQLPAGNSFTVVNGEIRRENTVTALEPSWTQNESTFKSIPLKYVLDEFERQFNIEVETKNITAEQLFTGTFSNTNINLALKSIGTPSQIRYKLEKDKVLFYAGNTP